MSQKLGNEETQNDPSQKDPQGEISWEEAVARYLEDQSDFLLRHPEVLSKLILRHDAGAGVVSLIEHQVRTLRTQNLELTKQLRDMVSVARDNDSLSSRLHRFALAMIGVRTADEAMDAAYEMLRQEFRIDFVSIRVHRKPAGIRPEYVAPDDFRLNELLRHFDGTKPLLDSVSDESLRRYLFGNHASEVRASALIPLGLVRPEGVLALGVNEASRFHAGMGTLYLSRLGELLSRVLAIAPG